jgi:predicted DNA-binding protein
MATTTTTIRVSAQTRDRLNALAAREGGSAGEIVAKLVYAADDEQLLADAEADFEKLARDPKALAVYHREAREIESGFEAPAPEW